VGGEVGGGVGVLLCGLLGGKGGCGWITRTSSQNGGRLQETSQTDAAKRRPKERAGGNRGFVAGTKDE